ncbi:sugar phosphate isomerase/epimerase [Paenibacillus frigoriresistens]|uniref:sugar phosphate isomerase/epimerase family protein n=1 Tax=Paenibacillus alginolyticus TaxID=59839 RepID=UPI0015674FCC|nr:sugar phosphate isomerase/epimerase [Paenibacillus frigoriresistens]NRF95901.1 sugar phosphate isomerase/epimerase [Paenibacillus frigoriresistens]
MKIKSIKALWGMDGSLESQFERIAAAGYDGIESPLPNPSEEKEYRSLLGQYNLDYIAMVFTGGNNHAESFSEQVERAATFGPIKINSHSAKDGMPFNEQAVFFEKAQAVEQRLGIPIGHETHRGRAMFTPWTTAVLLREFPELKLTSDFSHWVCVCESLLEDQKENLELAFQRTIHIHARVGFAQGPQVPHPAAPEYAVELSAHEEWWKRIIQTNLNTGIELTFTPEFGPPAYMPRLPFTNQPVADLWQVCLWMKQRFEQMLSGYHT